MLQDCNKIHIPSFNETCCLTHLIEMNEYANDHFLSSKYTKFFLKEILPRYKEEKLDYVSYNKETTNKLMKIILHQLCHFFSMNKFRFAKLMVNIALDFHYKSIFRSHPEIIASTAAVYNNVACIYERTGVNDKALKYFNHFFKYAVNPIDKLIYYNNALKVLMKMNRVAEIDDMVEKFKVSLFEEIERAKKEKLIALAQNEQNKMNDEFISKCKLLTFLMYNYSLMIELNGNSKEVKDNYKKGYEFSLSMLGETNLYTSKFVHKLDTKRPIAISRSKTLNTDTRSKTPNKRPAKLTRKETVGNEINKKVDKIIQQLGKISDTSPKSDMIIQASENAIAKSENNRNGSSVSRMKDMMKHKIRPIVDIVNGNSTTKQNQKDMTKNMIDEVIKEFEEESVAVKPKSSTILPMTHPPNIIPKQKEKPVEKKEVADSQYKKPLRIKQLFQRVMGITKKEEEPQGKFSQMITSLLNDKEETKPNKNLQQPSSNTLGLKNTIDNDEVMFNSSRKDQNVFDIDLDKSMIMYPVQVPQKEKDKLSISRSLSFFDSLLSSPVSKPASFTIYRRFNDVDFTISLTVSNTTFSFVLLNSLTNEKFFSLNLEFKKIKSTLSKMCLLYGIKNTSTLLSINSIDKFSMFFTQFISILKSTSSSHKYKFGISPTPIGLVVDKRIEFKIAKYSYVIDIVDNFDGAYRAVITSISSQNNFCVNIHTSTPTITDIDKFILKITAKLQEGLKAKKDLDFMNENTVYNLYLDNDDSSRFIISEIENDKLTICLVEGSNNIKFNVDDSVLYNMFGVKLKTIKELIKEEKNIVLNIISDYVVRDESSGKEIKIDNYISDIDIVKENNEYLYRFCDIRNERRITHYIVRCYHKVEEKEVVKIFLKKEKGDINTDDILKKLNDKVGTIYYDNEFALFDAIENYNNFLH